MNLGDGSVHIALADQTECIEQVAEISPINHERMWVEHASNVGRGMTLGTQDEHWDIGELRFISHPGEHFEVGSAELQPGESPAALLERASAAVGSS